MIAEASPEIRHVLQFLPDASGRALQHRVGLLKARDMAAGLRGRTDSVLADWLACACHDLAGQLVFRATETEARLDLAVQLCRKLMGAALAADSLHSDEFPL